MITPAESQRLNAVERAAFARITPKQRRAIAWPQNGPMGRPHREADRALYKLLAELRAAGCRQQQIAKALKVSSGRLHRLRTEPPSEEQVERRRLALEERRRLELEWYRQQQAIRQERWERERAAYLEAERIRNGEEAQDTVAWAKNCLIEAFDDMRGHPDLPVVRDV